MQDPSPRFHGDLPVLIPKSCLRARFRTSPHPTRAGHRIVDPGIVVSGAPGPPLKWLDRVEGCFDPTVSGYVPSYPSCKNGTCL